MSNAKAIAVLLVACALLSCALLFLPERTAHAQAPAITSLLKPDDACRRIELVRTDGANVVLERTAAGWSFVRPPLGAADAQTVARLLDKLMFSQVSDVKTEAELLRLGRVPADFALAEPPLTVAVSNRQGTVTRISFGNATPMADGVYAAVEGRAAVCVVPADVLAALSMPVDGFRSRRLFTADADKVGTLDIKSGLEPVKTFSRRENGWTTGGERASDRAIDGYLYELAEAAAAEFVWPVASTNLANQISESLLASYGLDPESAVAVTFRDLDGKASEKVVFGRTAERGLVYALVQNGTAIVTVPAALKDKVRNASSVFMDARLFPIDEKAVERFSLVDGETPYTVVREAAAWRIETPIVAPADARVVETLLRRLLTVTASDAAAGGSGMLVSFATNAASVSVSRERILGDMRLDDLRSCDVVRIEPARVRRLVRDFGGSRISVIRPDAALAAGGKGGWRIEATDAEATPDGEAIAAVLAALDPLAALRIEKLKVPAADLDDYGLDRPYLTLAVDLDDETAVRRNVLVGNETSGGRYLTVGSSDAVFVVSDEFVDLLTSDFIRR